ncbi:hypothetical protein M1P56_27830 [Streptomyces sp. HU2014]|uniref:hypothetical protein n=1 Tax=Streptomyces sp. HU2014 TaxID=2939414 RepID=UPI00200FE8AD|nr:hypothetical protein [Streptomyces sp. HU2014]UQI47874.1 hypothetical protein M1P56_27830 [Streptomyces sp. HU2014]
MSHTTVAWFDSLTASVFALGAAARETRLARQAAEVATWHIDPARLRAAIGDVNICGEYRISPQDVALNQIRGLCRAYQSVTTDLYENLALAYAYGTAGALLAVVKGYRPRYVELRRDQTEHYDLPDEPLPDFRGDLGTWSGQRRLALLRSQVGARRMARFTGRSEGGLAGLADCAYAYGEQAEMALHHQLLTARPAHGAPEVEQ